MAPNEVSMPLKSAASSEPKEKAVKESDGEGDGLPDAAVAQDTDEVFKATEPAKEVAPAPKAASKFQYKVGGDKISTPAPAAPVVEKKPTPPPAATATPASKFQFKAGGPPPPVSASTPPVKITKPAANAAGADVTVEKAAEKASAKAEPPAPPAAKLAAAPTMKLATAWSIWTKDENISDWAASLQRTGNFEHVETFWEQIGKFGAKTAAGGNAVTMPPVAAWTPSTWFTMMRYDWKPVQEGEFMVEKGGQRFKLRCRLQCAQDVWTVCMLSLIGEQFRHVNEELDVCGMECKVDREGTFCFFIWWLNPSNKLDKAKTESGITTYINAELAKQYPDQRATVR